MGSQEASLVRLRDSGFRVRSLERMFDVLASAFPGDTRGAAQVCGWWECPVTCKCERLVYSGH